MKLFEKVKKGEKKFRNLSAFSKFLNLLSMTTFLTLEKNLDKRNDAKKKSYNVNQ